MRKTKLNNNLGKSFNKTPKKEMKADGYGGDGIQITTIIHFQYLAIIIAPRDKKLFFNRNNNDILNIFNLF